MHGQDPALMQQQMVEPHMMEQPMHQTEQPDNQHFDIAPMEGSPRAEEIQMHEIQPEMAPVEQEQQVAPDFGDDAAAGGDE